MKWLKKLICKIFGHDYWSDELPVLRCVRCGARFPVDEHEQF